MKGYRLIPKQMGSIYYRELADPIWCEYDKNIYVEIFDLFDLESLNKCGYAKKNISHLCNIENATANCSNKLVLDMNLVAELE